MGKRGPQSKPTSLKVAAGTHRADRHGDPEREPGQILPALPSPPEAMNQPQAIEKWNEVGGLLVGMQLLAESDLPGLRIYCEAWADREKCQQDIDRLGIVTEDEKLNPAVRYKRDCEEIIRRFHDAFAMTASARAGVQVGTKKPRVDARKRG